MAIGDNLRRALELARAARQVDYSSFEEPPVDDLPSDVPEDVVVPDAPEIVVSRPVPSRKWAEDARAAQQAAAAAADGRARAENQRWRAQSGPPSSFDSAMSASRVAAKVSPEEGRAVAESMPEPDAARHYGRGKWPLEASRRIQAERDEAARRAQVESTAEERAKQRAAEVVEAEKKRAQGQEAAKTASAAAARTSQQAAATRQAMTERQRAETAKRRAESAADLSTTEEEIEEKRSAATEQYSEDAGRPNPVRATQDQLDRADTARELREHEAALGEWKLKDQELLRRYGEAQSNGDRDLMLQISRQRAAHNEARPVLSERASGGLTPQEQMEPVGATLESLPAAERQALKDHYARTHAWGPDGRPDVDAKGRPIVTPEVTQRVAQDMAVQYGDLTPEQRRQAMINDARRVMSAPTVPAAESGAAGGPGTVGYGTHNNSERLTPEMTRSLPRDKERPDGTVKPGGLTWTADDARVKPGYGDIVVENGRQRAQAPGTQILPYVDMVQGGQLPLRWDGSPEWINHMTAVGHILRLDPAQHSPESFALEAARKLGDVVRMTGKDPVTGERRFTIAPVLMEGDNPHYTYVPTAATQSANAVQRLRTDVGSFIDSHALHPQEQAALWEAADAGDQAAVAQIKRNVYRSERGTRANALQDRRKTEQETRSLQDPRLAPAMLSNSLGRTGGDPSRTATVYRQFGMPDEANRALEMENRRIAAGGEAEEDGLRRDVMRGRGKDDNAPDIATAYTAGVGQILDRGMGVGVDEPVDAMTTRNAYLQHENQYRKATGRPAIDEKQAAYEVGQRAVTRGATIAHPLVSQALAQIIPTLSRFRAKPGQTAVGPVDDQRTTFIKEARRLVVGDKFTDEELGRWFETNAPKP